MSSTYDANNSGWYEAYMELEKILGSLDNTMSAFGGAGFCPISENVDRLFDGFAALSFCRDNLEYELFVEIDEKLMKKINDDAERVVYEFRPNEKHMGIIEFSKKTGNLLLGRV